MTARDTAVLTICSTTPLPGNVPFTSNSEIAALSTSDTSSRKPTTSTIANEASRSRRRALRPPPLRGGISQITSRAARSSSKAPPAPNRSITVPKRVAITPCPGLRAFSIMLCTPCAASWPMSPSICADDPALGRVLPEGQAGQRDADEQERRDREDHVVREGGPQARRVVLVPVAEGLLDHAEDVPRRHVFLHVPSSHRRREGGAGPRYNRRRAPRGRRRGR